jgi:hypothetical protein
MFSLNISQERRAVESLVFVSYGPVNGSNLTLATLSGGSARDGGLPTFAPDFCAS